MSSLMNRLSTEERAASVAALVRRELLTGTAKMTVLNPLRDLSCACAAYHHKQVRGLRVRRLQCDEVWSFVGAKAKNVRPERDPEGWGDVWTWTAIDADTKLYVSYFVGGRDAGCADEFMQDCASRIRGRVQITTDGHRVYVDAVEGAFRDGG